MLSLGLNQEGFPLPTAEMSGHDRDRIAKKSDGRIVPLQWGGTDRSASE